MFEAAAKLVERLAPVLLFIDDLHWADRGTIELLHYIGRRSLVMATYRTSETTSPLNDLVTQVRRADHTAIIDLAPFDDDEVAELAGGLPTELLADITRRAKGIPLFITALAQAPLNRAAAIHNPATHTPANRHSLPTIVRDVILARLHQLAEPERRLTEIIAVAGDAATDQVLEAVWEGVDIQPVLRRLRDEGLITEHVTGRAVTYRVAHPLYAEVAYAELTAGERRGLHAALAKTIDRLDPDDVLSLAPHYLQAGGHVNSARAADILGRAGWRAMNVQAIEEAVQYLGAALAEARGNDKLTAELLDGLGRAHMAHGDLQEAGQAWHEGVVLAEQCGAAGPLSSMRYWLAMLESGRGNFALSERHWLAAETPSDIESALVDFAISARYIDIDQSRAAANRLIASVNSSSSPMALATSHLGHAVVAKLNGDFDTALRLARLSYRQSEEVGHELTMLGAWANRELVALLVLAGDIAGASAQQRRAADTFGERLAPFARVSFVYTVALVRYLAGDVNAALSEIETVVPLAQESALPRAVARAQGLRAFLLAEQGRTTAAEALLTEARTVYATDEPTIVALTDLAATSVAFHSGHPELAPELTEWTLHIEPLVMSLRLLFAGIVAEDKTAIVAHLRELGRTSPFLDAHADRFEGLPRAADKFEAMDAPLFAAQAKLESGDRDAIVDSITMFERAGAMPWANRARQAARVLGVRVPTTRKPGALSNRETEVVRLLGDGLSNADIAERLFVSQRTVETHLRNSYAKLGLNSRVALAHWAAENAE